MFRQIIQSAINSGRLKFAHEQENDQLKSVGLDDKKLQNWPTSASPCNKKNIYEKEDSKPSSDIEDIVQIEDVSKDDELNKNLENIGGANRFFTIGTRTDYS